MGRVTYLKSWVTHQLLGFNLSFLLMVILLKQGIWLRMERIVLIASDKAWFDYEAA